MGAVKIEVSTMQKVHQAKCKPLLLIVAGAKGAIGSTVGVTIAALKKDSHAVQPYLTTAPGFPHWVLSQRRNSPDGMSPPGPSGRHWNIMRVLPPEKSLPQEEYLDGIRIRQAPLAGLSLPGQVERLIQDIQEFKGLYPENRPVFINLLPACEAVNLGELTQLDQLYSQAGPATFPDLAYTLSAVLSGLPVVNFTPNETELPLMVSEALKAGAPLCGRDGKTGQTYLKVVLASALKARNLRVDGWYSLNILGQ